jgi:nucleoside-diphosphate-sugar epimerase
MRVLVTGTEGYIGSVLAPHLIERGHDVVGVDTGFYRDGWLYDASGVRPWTLCKDIRLLTAQDFDGIDAVVHMAELSNDPLSELVETATYEINHAGSLHVAATAKAAGVTRFVYTSSCSVYGAAVEDLVDEESPLRPQTTYAICKQLVERDVSGMADDRFSPTFLRNATAYGASPRMRFDIVLNNLAGLAWTTKEIRMESDGTPWRPLVHVLDIAKAVAGVLESPRERVHDQVLNVGDPAGNYQIREIAEIVGRVFPDCEVTVAGRGPDARSYRVSFAKIRDVLPEFVCDWNAELGAQQLLDVFSLVDLDETCFRSRTYTRLKQIQHLLATGQIDETLLWRPGARAAVAG